MLDISAIRTMSMHSTIITNIYSVLLSFILSTGIAVTYEKTFRGLSYSRNYIQALILGSVVAGTIMQAIGDSVAQGLGILGALAIIRFRTNFKDPRDIIFMFAALAVGVSTGVNAFSIAITGSIGFCIIAFILYYMPIGYTNNYDGMLRFNMEVNSPDRNQLEQLLLKNCKIFALITLRDMTQGKRLDYAYHVKLKRNISKEEFISDLQGIQSIKGINLMLQETTVEV